MEKPKEGCEEDQSEPAISKIAFIPYPQIQNFFKKLLEKYTVLAPVQHQNHQFLETVKSEMLSKLSHKSPQLNFPFKILFFPPKEKILEYEIAENDISVRDVTPEDKVVLFGMKACDLKSIEILDRVFLDAPVDAHYKAKRDNTILVTSDCTEGSETCFCVKMGLKPYPEAGYDLNLSEVGGGCIIESGSEKGDKILEEIREITLTASDEQLDERKWNRDSISYELMEKGYKFREKFRNLVSSADESYWEELSKKCVECSGCTYICPTCHCFYVSDEKGETWNRFRMWDSCLSEAFQKMAGGANPRSALSSRLRQRLHHKFVYFKDNYDEYACVGCGRCIGACLGGIDIRELLRELQQRTSNATAVESHASGLEV